MNLYTLFKTKKGNRYLYDHNVNKAILCHPLLYHIISLSEIGVDLSKWQEELFEENNEIGNIGIFSKNEIQYYYQKYLMLNNNGFFEKSDNKKSMFIRLKPEDIEEAIANNRLVTFEVTDRCNLSCEYCGYGKFYNNYDKRKNKLMDVTSGIQMLEYLTDYWNSSLNRSHNQNIFIGFYGGEPLLNFPFIEQIVEYSKNINLLHNHFSFSMTTNGLFLSKYMDFLAKNQFNLLVSLDGSEENNRYRVFKNGKPVFGQITENIRILQAKYPEYFENYVNFNAVLHNMNSVSSIFNHIKSNFNKIPRISMLNSSGIEDSQKKAFWDIYSNVNESLFKSEDYHSIEDEMFIKLPNIQSLSTFLHSHNDFSFFNYKALMTAAGKNVRIPTGTCVPFSKKIFVTVNGKILPCERIGQQYYLGTISRAGVILNFRSISERYNHWYEKIKKQCVVCRNSDQCTECVFNLDLVAEQPKCTSCMSQTAYSKFLSKHFDFIEKKPEMYSKIFQKVRLS